MRAETEASGRDGKRPGDGLAAPARERLLKKPPRTIGRPPPPPPPPPPPRSPPGARARKTLVQALREAEEEERRQLEAGARARKAARDEAQRLKQLKK